MTFWVKATTEDKGTRVTVESERYLVTVSSSVPGVAWTEAWRAFDRAMSAPRERVAG